MNAQPRTADVVEHWIENNQARLHNRFAVLRIGDWRLCEREAIVLDLMGEFAVGSITVVPADVPPGSLAVWPYHLLTGGRAAADFEVLDMATGERRAGRWLEPFTEEFLDAFLAAMEAADVRSTPPGPPT